ncbi:hypothetical protein ACFS3C_12800 [Azotobacter vinelandii]
MYNELAAISRYNVQARRLKASISSARPLVANLIEQATAGGLRGRFTADDLRHWRLSSISLLAGTTVVYDVWMRSLVLEALDFIVQIVASACQYAANSPEACWVQEIIEIWARRQGIIADSYVMPDNLYQNVDLPPYGKMILDFGVIYKRRRLNFVLHEINDRYPEVSDNPPGVVDPESLDLLKIKIHKCIDELSIYDDIDFSQPAGHRRLPGYLSGGGRQGRCLRHRASARAGLLRGDIPAGRTTGAGVRSCQDHG